jgi:hypothetical protein
MTRIVGYFILLFASMPASWGYDDSLGNIQVDSQVNPLNYIFQDREDLSNLEENKKIHFYQHLYVSSMVSKNKCSSYEKTRYFSYWDESQAKRTIVASLQYYGLNEVTKVLGPYAKALEINEEDYRKLSERIVSNYCSKNLTVMSIKRVESLLKESYANASTDTLPTMQASPFVTDGFKQKAGTKESFSREFDYALKNFKSFCSWGGEVRDLRLLTPYLKNPFIMEMVGREVASLETVYNQKALDFSLKKNDFLSRVVCQDVVCRPSDKKTFEKFYPKTIGSIGIKDDVERLYCDYFKNLEYAGSQSIPEVKAWIKAQELEDPIFETNFFISLMTKVPDLFFGIKNYKELPMLLRSSVDYRWNQWAKLVLNTFSQDILFEESLKIKAKPRRSVAALADKGFTLDFSFTVGELDRLSDDSDKLDTTFHMTLSKNYLRSLRVEWNNLAKNVDYEGQKLLKEKIAQYLGLQLKEKEKLFHQKVWNDQFSRIMAEELLSQVLVYQGSLFNSYQEEMVKIPVNFSYGVFALGYLRYRADVQAGRMKLNL